MKKLMVISILGVLLAAAAQAKVEGFNSLIDDNAAAQKQLHNELSNEVGQPKAQTAKTETFIDIPQTAVNAPTNQKTMRFQKEVVDHQAPTKKSAQRLANELKSADMTF